MRRKEIEEEIEEINYIDNESFFEDYEINKILNKI